MSYALLPIFPHLLDLLHCSQQRGIRLILIGGLGLYIKREEVVRQGVIDRERLLPDARATSDIDALIQIADLGDVDKRQALRDVICEELGYEPDPAARYFKFFRDVVRAGQEIPDRIKIDLHSRERAEGEAVRSKPSSTRIPPECKILQARKTKEAFAVEARPCSVVLEGQRSGGQACTVEVLLPHLFASLVMKLRAALDHVETAPAEREPRNRKHAFDVYLILSMMTADDWQESLEMVQMYVDEPELRAVRAGLKLLFGSDSAPGCEDLVEVHRAGGGASGDLDLPWLRGSLFELLG